MSFEIKLPNAQGWTENIDSAIDSYLGRYFPNDPRIVLLPVLPRCDWEAPTGDVPGSIATIAGFPEAKSSDKEHLVTKFITESTVRNALSAVFETNGTKTLILSGPELSPNLIGMLNSYLGTNLTLVHQEKTAWSKELTDLLIINESAGVVLVEVKPSLAEVRNNKAYKELKWAEEWISGLLKEAFPSCEIPVRKVLALPWTKKDELHQEGQRTLHLFQEDIASLEALNTWTEKNQLWNEDRFREFNKLYRALFLLKIAKFQKGKAQASKVHVKPETVDTHLVERQLVDTLTSQAYLSEPFDKQEKFRNPKKGLKKAEQSKTDSTDEAETKALQVSEHGLFSEKPPHLIEKLSGSAQKNLDLVIFNEVLILNPEQMSVWDSPYPQQLITGYASTGKTVLIQNKALELLRGGKNVAIIIPDCINSYYIEFFAQNGIGNGASLQIGNLTMLMQQELDGFHLLFDEVNILSSWSSAEQIQGSLKVLRTILKKDPQCLLWAAFDTCQCFVVNMMDKDPSINFPDGISTLIKESRFGSRKKLTTSLRCTQEIYKEWRINVPGGELLRIGHNVHGIEPTVLQARVNLSQVDGASDSDKKLNVVANSIVNGVAGALQDGWKTYEIVVALNTPLTTHEPLFEKLREMSFDFTSATGRFVPGGLEQVTAVTVDTPFNIVTHEWPVVIEVDDPLCYYVPSAFKYIAKSRCLLRLITLRVLDPTVEANKPIPFSNVLQYGSISDLVSLIGDLVGDTITLLLEMEEYIDVVLWRDFSQISSKLPGNNANVTWTVDTLDRQQMSTLLQSSRERLGYIAKKAISNLNTFHDLLKDSVETVKAKWPTERRFLRHFCMDYFRLLRTWHETTQNLSDAGFPLHDTLKLDLNVPAGLLLAGEKGDPTDFIKVFQKKFCCHF